MTSFVRFIEFLLHFVKMQGCQLILCFPPTYLFHQIQLIVVTLRILYFFNVLLPVNVKVTFPSFRNSYVFFIVNPFSATGASAYIIYKVQDKLLGKVGSWQKRMIVGSRSKIHKRKPLFIAERVKENCIGKLLVLFLS